jgi:hypothetical protein
MEEGNSDGMLFIPSLTKTSQWVSDLESGDMEGQTNVVFRKQASSCKAVFRSGNQCQRSLWPNSIYKATHFD